MKKNVWIFLLAVLLPSVVLGWLALRSAEEQQIVFERRTAELYQKETDSLAVTVRDTVDAERRAFGETVHRLLAKGDAEALARDFTNTLADAWEVKAVGFAINRDGKLASPSVASASKQPELQRFLLGNGGFLTSTEPAIVYNWAGDNNTSRVAKNDYGKNRALANQGAGNTYANASNTAPAGGYAAKDAAQNADGKAGGNDVIILAKQGTGFGNSTLNFPGASNDLSGLAGLEQIKSQAPLNIAPTPVLTGSQTLVLNGAAQNMGQVPANGSTFDFSGLMSAPASQTVTGTLNGILPAGTAPNSTTALNFPSQKSDELQRKEIAPPAAAPMPAVNPEILAQAPRASAPVPGGTPTAVRAPMGAPEAKLAEKDTTGADAAPGGKAGDFARDTAALKMKSVQPGVGDEVAKKSALSKSEHPLQDASEPPDTASAASAKTREREDRQSPPKTGLSRPQPEPPGAGKKPGVPAPAAATAGAEAPPSMSAQSATAPARRVVETQAQIFPAAKSQAAAAKPAASRSLRNADAAQGARFADDMPSESSQVTKSASALNLANNMTRQVEPQQMLGQQSAAVSSIIPETAEFRSLTEEGDEGLVARFVQDKLNLIYWVRPPEAPEMVFGCLVEAAHVPDLWKDVLERHSASSRGTLEPKPEFVLALLDDRGRPVATQPADAPARDWKRPFVASEIGEALPHWEAALYLASPTALAESARGLWRTLAFTIAGAVALIAFGGWLVVADARRQLALAQQKTDFVSNVSHELKTPLTSIRMFAELMHDRPQPAEKQNQYLRIITVEAERLTRLINNVLDFAKMGRKQKRLDLKPLDLHELAARVWESQEMHLRDAGFTTRWEAAPGPYPVLGDDDSLAQVLVNLLSNAEKYSNGNKEVELHTWLDDGWVNISVLDRGMGVPDGDEKKIFEAFYRAHDSLASGIQGSGLGLTLAQRIAREHGGEIRHEHREGGGSRFTLRIPLSKPAES
jgi:signal transduction histidine kinase